VTYPRPYFREIKRHALNILKIVLITSKYIFAAYGEEAVFRVLEGEVEKGSDRFRNMMSLLHDEIIVPADLARENTAPPDRDLPVLFILYKMKFVNSKPLREINLIKLFAVFQKILVGIQFTISYSDCEFCKTKIEGLDCRHREAALEKPQD